MIYGRIILFVSIYWIIYIYNIGTKKTVCLKMVQPHIMVYDHIPGLKWVTHIHVHGLDPTIAQTQS